MTRRMKKCVLTTTAVVAMVTITVAATIADSTTAAAAGAATTVTTTAAATTISTPVAATAISTFTTNIANFICPSNQRRPRFSYWKDRKDNEHAFD